MEDGAASSCVGVIIKLLYIIISRYYITQSINNESQFQHYKIHRRYGVLRRLDVSRIPRHRIFLIRKDLGGGRQRFHRWKCRVSHSVADGWDGDGEGGVGRQACSIIIIIQSPCKYNDEVIILELGLGL